MKKTTNWRLVEDESDEYRLGRLYDFAPDRLSRPEGHASKPQAVPLLLCSPAGKGTVAKAVSEQ